MQLHRHEAFEPVGHRRRFDRSSSSGKAFDHPVGRLDRDLVLAEEHRAVELEVVVVDAIEGVEVHRPRRARGISRRPRSRRCSTRPRRGSARRARRCGWACACRCPAVRHERRAASRPPRSARSGCGDISIRWMYMCSSPGWMPRCLVASARSSTSIASTVLAPSAGCAGNQVPEQPGGAVHQRLGEQRGDVEVVAEVAIDLRAWRRRRRRSRRRGPRAAPAPGSGRPAPGSAPVRPGWRASSRRQRLLVDGIRPRDRRGQVGLDRSRSRACCSSGRRRRRCPSRPSRKPGRPRPPARSSARPPRG